MESLTEFRKAISTCGGIHDIKRVLLFDSLDDMLICYINERDDGRSIQPMSRLKEVFMEFNVHGTERHRYYYHGGEHGVINGFFSYTDTMVYVYPKDGHSCIASISPYNLAHFMCDIFDDEPKCDLLSEWVFGNAFWRDMADKALSETREEKA